MSSSRAMLCGSRMTPSSALWPTCGATSTAATGKDGMFVLEDVGVAVVFEVAPTKVIAFAKGRFAQTRYRFQRN